MEEKPQRVLPANWIVLLLWMGVHIVGFLVSNTIVLLSLDFVDLTIASLLLMLGELPVYALQAIVLGYWLLDLPRRSWFLRSVLATFASNIAAALLMSFAGGEQEAQVWLAIVIHSLVVGAGIGLVQSVILQCYVQYSELWVAAYALGIVLVRVATFVFRDAGTPEEWLFIGSFLSGLLFGGSTGLALLWLMAHRRRPSLDPAWLPSQGGRTFDRQLVIGIIVSLLLVVSVVAFLNPAREPGLSAAATQTRAAGAIEQRTPGADEAAYIAEGWQLYTSDSGGFDIMLPMEPFLDTQQIDGGAEAIPQYVFAATSDLAEYIVLYSDYPQSPRPHEVSSWLDQIRDGVVESMVGRLLSEQEITVQGYPGREIVFERSNGMTLRSWIVIADRRIYQAGAMTYDPASAAREIEMFLRSFRIFLPQIEV